MTWSAELSQTWWMILVSVASGVTGQTFLKLGTERAGNGADGGILSLIGSIVTSPLTLLGLFFYGCGALAWIAVLRRMDLSYAYPFLALNFVLIALVSYLFLGEAVPALRWLGIGIICIGILVVARAG
jgi:multidrug transporter EmrE-like cation transporter